MNIRPAVLEDADEIDRIHVQAWIRAYSDFIAPEDMPSASTPADERVARWRERMSHHEIRTWVYEVEGAVAGFAAAGGGELWALYVDPAAQGAGVGSALLAHAEAAMREAGSEQAALWVFRDNEHGRRFYEARGWTLLEGSEDQGEYVAPHVEYRKPL